MRFPSSRENVRRSINTPYFEMSALRQIIIERMEAYRAIHAFDAPEC